MVEEDFVAIHSCACPLHEIYSVYKAVTSIYGLKTYTQ
jgi:hypothetical protein